MNILQTNKDIVPSASLPRTPHKNATTTTMRISSDFSSIEPSQSASQMALNHAHEEQPPPEPAVIHLIRNAPAFGEPISPSIATTTTVAPPAPGSRIQYDPPPSSGNSTTTTAGLSIRYSVATSATYTVENVAYAQAIPLSSGAVVTTEKGKAKKEGIFFLGRSKCEPVRAHLVCDGSKTKIYTRPFPALHAIEGYAPGIPTAGPPSGVQSIRRVFDAGRGRLRGWGCCRCGLVTTTTIACESG